MNKNVLRWRLNVCVERSCLRSGGSLFHARGRRAATQNAVSPIGSDSRHVTAPYGVVLLGRLPKVDLIILEGGGNVRPYTSVRPSVHKKVSSISMKFGI